MHVTVTASNGQSANEVSNANRMSNVFLGQWKQLPVLCLKQEPLSLAANASAQFWSNIWKMLLTARPWAEHGSCSARGSFNLFKYNFSRCYCKKVVGRYVDSLVCRLRNQARSAYLRSLSFRNCHSTASPFLITSFWKFCFSKISVFCLIHLL